MSNTQPTYTNCQNCGSVDHSNYPYPCACHSTRETCPKIPQGYGTDPGDCACGNCPEAR